MIRYRAVAPLALLLFARLASASPPAAPEIAAVISSAPGPYQAAYDSFVKTLGREPPTVRLPGRPSVVSARVFVAFGGEAVVQTYPKSSTVIACLAPGLAGRTMHKGAFVFVAMKPAPAKLLSELRRVQPGLKRLAVLSQTNDMASYLADLKLAAAALGIEILAPRARGPDEIPDALRALLADKADAVWLAPDPSLVTSANFQTIKQFSRDNGIPFYAPTHGLAAAGASAAVSVKPEEAGRLAAELVRRALAGETLPNLVYPERTQLTVNQTAAEKAGLRIRAQALGKDAEVIR